MVVAERAGVGVRVNGKAVSRRSFLELSGAALLSSAVARERTSAEILNAKVPALELAVERLLGSHARQIHLRLTPQINGEVFHLSGSSGRILVEGSSRSALLMGVNWYLKYFAGVSISWNGDCVDHLPETLPAPTAPIKQEANVSHRFALNDTNDGYTGPYWRWEQWERLIDVLALHGINKVLVYIGAEAVYQQTFSKFNYTDEELRRWFPTPAHQPWWLLENMSGWIGPSVSQQLIDSRIELASKITRRLRELGVTPVLPGYYGMVPDGFAEKVPGARTIPQGTWLGMKRPDWMDPTCECFADVAAEFYKVQELLLGPSTMFKMDPLHEGGRSGGVDLGRAAARISDQLQAAHPGATWAILGWQDNPKRDVLDGIKDKDHLLILDGQADRYAFTDREVQWDGTAYAFGTIWNFGGHTTMGANMEVWSERYFRQLTKHGSKLSGIAVMPEASCNNPVAFALMTELAWMNHRPDLAHWFVQWSAYRYGGSDDNALRAWQILHDTAYNEKCGQWSEAHDDLFSAEPNLTVKSACSWSPQQPRYDLAVFQEAIGYLLRVAPSLRTSAAYRYDLVDVARQTLANQSRTLLPKINEAYLAYDPKMFHKLTEEWLERITQLNRIVGTEDSLLLGAWLVAARAAGRTVAEQNQLEFDARSILVEWGPVGSSNSGVHDYANREWNGLLEFYRERWALYFSSLAATFESQRPVKPVDWFEVNQNWAKQTNRYPVTAEGNSYAVVSEILERYVLPVKAVG